MTTKTELIGAVAAATGQTLATTREIVDATIDVIGVNLVFGNEVKLVGLGVFTVKDTPAKAGRNPATGAAITIAAGRRIGFKPGKDLKARL